MKLTTKLLTGSLATAAFFAGYATSPDKPAPTTHDSQAKACWYELKTVGDSEQICGKVSLAPDNAYNFSVYTDAHLDEDQPGWDCKTMGNKICGPTTTLERSSWQNTSGSKKAISEPASAQSVALASKPSSHHVPSTTSTTQTIPQQLIDRIPDSDAELAYCEAINQPVGQCQMPEHEGMGEQ